MANEENEKKEEVVENKEAEGEKKEKKENGFSKFFKKIGKNISDSQRESNIEHAFRDRKDVKEYNIYTDDSALFSTHSYYGILDEEKNQITVYGEIKETDVPYSSILSTIVEDADKELPKRYYIFGLTPSTIDVEIEEKDDKDNVVKNTYNRPTTILTLDPNVEEVKVVKVKNTYFVKKNKD